MKYQILLAVFGLSSTFAHAEGIGASVKAGTLGLGAEVSTQISEKVTTRIGFNTYNYKFTGTQSSVDYDINFKLKTLAAIADWYPWAGAFRTSAGLMYNKNKATLHGVPAAGATYTINGTSYAASSAVQSLDGSMTFKPIAPYLGLGWGNPVAKDKTWGFVADVGLLYQQAPEATLQVTCASGFAGCATLQADAAAEQTKLQSSLSDYKWWPVLSFGVSYRF